MPYRKHGINPRLISIATGKNLADIPASPPPSQLPGYATLFYPKIEELIELPGGKYMLSCQSCGKKGEYPVGTMCFNAGKYVKISKEKDHDPLDAIQFTGYFRCKHCNSSGPWNFPNQTERDIMLFFMARYLQNQTDEMFKGLATFDGHSFAWAAEAEEYYLDKLQPDPSDSWIWNRLGNHYFNGGRPDLAVVAFQQSIGYDPNQFESHLSLGRLLFEADYEEESLTHLRQAIKSAPDYTRLPPLELREMLAVILKILYAIHQDPHRVLDEIINLAREDFQPPSVITMVNLEVNFNSAKGLYPLAEMLMGNQKNLLVSKQRAIIRPNGGPVHPKQKKPPKKKTKKR